MPRLGVNQARLLSLRAVPTPVLALEVQRAGIPGPPGAERFEVLMLSVSFCRHWPIPDLLPSLLY